MSESIPTEKPAAALRVAYLVSHPIQYQAPLLRYLVKEGGIDLTVLFLSDFSLKSYVDSGFGVKVQWDVPLLEGYRSEVLPRLGKNDQVTTMKPFHTNLRKLLAGRFDVLWSHGYAHLTNLRAMRIARRLGMKVLLRCESNLTSHARGRMKKWVKARLLSSLFARIDGFLAIGKANADYYRYYGVPDAKIVTMPYAVDNRFFAERAAAAAPSREILRASLGLASGVPVILFASKFQGRKRAGDLWRAYRSLSPDGKAAPAAYLLYIGDGEDRPAIEAEAVATGWPTVKFLGFRNQTELPAFYDLCDVFVLPSEFEPWGLVVNEVMNASRPVIASDQVGAAPDLLIPEVTGHVFPVGDIAALADRLRRVISDPLAARAMGERAFKHVQTWDFAADLRGLRAMLAGFAKPSEGPRG